ncbi:MAG: hypothetical protein GPJ50_03260 [Candidatus Heimdallarchaeota archaeon]|nr:hypothetical protein [Candidatus Heimdallarchaeota archaeon]
MTNVYHKDLIEEHLHQPFWAGLDANKPANPIVGDWYYATDIDVLFKCSTAGVWEFYPRKIGKGNDYIEVASDGFLTLHGEARTSRITTYACENWYTTHHDSLGVKVLADPGYISSTLTTPPDINRLLRLVGVGEGIHLKGEQSNSWSAGDTTHDAVYSYITVATRNTTWEQASSWRLEIEIAVGDVTGKMTLYLPPFKLDAYEKLHFWITNDGASYCGGRGECKFTCFGAGSTDVDEILTGDISKGDNVVCPVSDTTGFYIGDKARLEDDNHSEWDRITDIIINTSIKVEHLDYDYTQVANAKIKKYKCVETPYGVHHMRRGIGRLCCLRAEVPSGIAGHYAFPFTQDPISPMKVAVVFTGDIDNPTSETIRLRLQYVPTGPGDNALSDEWGKMKYITVTPGAKAGDFVETLFTGGFEIPASEILNKKAVQLQLVRMGDDSINDTYTGCLLVVAILIGLTEKYIGADMRL